MNGMPSLIWPLFDLGVSTPRLSLRYVTDSLAAQLAELAAGGIHDPASMPFSEPWTDVDPPELQRNTLRYFWQCRADTTEHAWTLNLATFDHREELVGVCSLSATRFPLSRTATTGSWIGRSHQRRGLGTEMRQAALHLLFTGLRAEHADTRAWHDNTASLAVTRGLPYTQGQSTTEQRRHLPDTMLAFSMSRDQWHTVRRGDIELHGIAPVREFLGLEDRRTLDS
jgi:RimJ/RimL family protein N-acetyltransferase